MALFKRKKPNREPDDVPGLRPEDRATLGHLAAAGARLDEPRHVVHYLYLPSEETAATAGEQAAAAGWDAEVRSPLPEDPERWTVVCEHEAAVLTPAFVRDATDFFDDLARGLGGTYDGWEASV